jgi:hypothetical protein
MNIMVRLLLILAAMIAFLTTMVVTHAHHRAHGREVVLAMEPVDPRDLLLGYYSIIRTDAHTLDMAELEGAKTGWEVGDRIFVTLEDGDDGAAFPVAVSPQQPASGVFLQGRVRSVSTQTDWEDVEEAALDPEDENWSPLREPVPGTERDVLGAVYNLEAYYAEAEQAQELDTMRNQDRLRLIVSLAPDGRAVIKGLEIDGERRIDRIMPDPG